MVLMEISGDLSSRNFEELRREVNELASAGRDTRLLVEVHELKECIPENGWELESFVGADGAPLFAKVAVIGETRVEQSLASFLQIFASAEVRLFTPEDADGAIPWLKEPADVTSKKPSLN